MDFFEESTSFFIPIENSIYVERKKNRTTEDDIFICECKPSATATPEELANPKLSFDCKEKCANRRICTECEVNSCPCGENCNNR